MAPRPRRSGAELPGGLGRVVERGLIRPGPIEWRLISGIGVVLIFLPLVSAAASTAADQPPRGYGQAMRWYEEAARAGNAEAQFFLGVILEKGVRGDPDPRAAADWYGRAAAAGHVEAQFRLGFLHASGTGADRDSSAAIRWYEAAARRGHRRAQYNLALLHQDATGLHADPLTAAYWYEAAARQGLREAQYNLALLYTGEFDGLYDPIRAYGWMDVAARQGHSLAERGRAALELAMTAADLAAGRQLADRLAVCCTAENETGAVPIR